MNVKHIVTILSSLVIGIWDLGFAAPLALAQSCTTQYGGRVVCPPVTVTINKQVKNPISSFFVENLSSTDPAFSPGSEVHFKLTIKNASNQTFASVTVKDVFPNHLSFASGPGTYDGATKTLTFTLINLLPGEARTQEILAKVDPASAFAAGKNFLCVVNEARVAVDTRSDRDTSQLCIQTQVLGATTLPVAGTNDLLLLLPFVGVGLGGLALLRKGSKT